MSDRDVPGREVTALASVVAIAFIAVGCGGSGSPGSEVESRQKLEAGAAKLTDARSFRVEVPVEAESDGESVEIACIDLAIDRHTEPERFDMLFFGQSCAGGTEAHELIAVGREAWVSSEPGSWTAATITPAVLDELDQEQTNLKGLFEAAEGIEAEADGAAVIESGGRAVDVPSYTFEAPASAFPGTEQELGDVQLHFEAVIDRRGFLRELTVHGDEEGTGATVTDKYEDVNEHLVIAPPGPAEVEGPQTEIRSKADLEELFDLPSS